MRGFPVLLLVILLFFVIVIIKDNAIDKCSEDYIPYASDECVK